MKATGRARAFFTSALLFLFLLLPASAMGAVKHVTEIGAGAKDGSSWANAYGEAEFRAVLSTSAGTEFWLAAGEYSPGDQENESFVPADGVTVYGGFKGDETSKDARDPQKNVTVLTGRISGTKNNYSVVWVENGQKLTLDGLTVTGGKGGENGGAVVCSDNAELTAINCRFAGNSAHLGGAIYNSAGGILKVKNCVFEGNSAVGTGAWGGAVFNKWYCEVEDCSFENNTASWPGGAIHNGQGGFKLTVRSSAFYRNSSTNSGGGAIFSYADLLVVNSTFVENSAAFYGGGAISCSKDSTSKIINCTFKDNKTNKGSGEAVRNSESNSFKAVNSIFWGGGTTGQIATENPVTLPEITYCIIQGGYDGNDAANRIINRDPRLGAFKDNGGPTKTAALLAGSPAIDAGTSAGAPGADQRGVTRPKGAGYDMGAYEYDGTSSGGGGCSAAPMGGPSFLLLTLPLAALFRKRS